jgi:hypothetical protein
VGFFYFASCTAHAVLVRDRAALRFETLSLSRPEFIPPICHPQRAALLHGVSPLWCAFAVTFGETFYPHDRPPASS